jgi:probable HAF family extracellular repeat protein
LPGHDSSWAAAINNAGQVAGHSRDYSMPGSATHAVRWDSSGEIQYLGDLPGGDDGSFAQGINNMGHAAGTSSATGGSRAFLWTSAGGMQNLGGIPGGREFSSGISIGNSGAVIGGGIAQNESRAFIWRSASGMQDLGELPGGDLGKVARAINSFDVVVGSAEVAASGPNRVHATIWTDATGMMDLNNLLDSTGAGWILNEARGINDAGQIVGYGRTPRGVVHGFLLTPVPEPSSTGLVLISVLGIATVKRPRRDEWRLQ